jgi:hypothetical protein
MSNRTAVIEVIRKMRKSYSTCKKSCVKCGGEVRGFHEGVDSFADSLIDEFKNKEPKRFHRRLK